MIGDLGVVDEALGQGGSGEGLGRNGVAITRGNGGDHLRQRGGDVAR